MLLSELTEAIYAAGYGFDTVQEARRFVMERHPHVAEAIMDRPLNTAQANPYIPENTALEILEKLSIPVEAARCP